MSIRICQIIPSLEEQHGGPSKSVPALARALAASGAAVDLLAAHSDQTESRDEGGLRTRVFPRSWPARFCCSKGLRQTLAGSRYDVIHSHALWLRPLHYAHQHAAATKTPLIISPRGMMTTWAWNFHRARKSAARLWVHPHAFEAAAGWHATSVQEAEDIRALGFTQPVCVSPNGVEAPTDDQRAASAAYWRKTCPDVEQRPTALFYGRFHRKKRVLELIDLWLAQPDRNWLLLIVGLPDDYTARQLELYVLRSSGGNRVRVYDGEGCPAPYAIASLFLLPSHSENFGLTVAEALANGVPVVVTDTTPWTAVNRAGAGWCVPWVEFGQALTAAMAESTGQRQDRGRQARTYVINHYSWQRSATLLLDFYEQIRANRS